MKSLLRRSILGVVIFLAMLSAQPAGAAPIALLDYTVTDIGGGQLQYDYTLRNESDPLLDAGADAYDLFLFLPTSISLVSWTTPLGWDLFSGVGFLETFSLLPGPSPTGTDVAPGQSLAGFSFVFDGEVTQPAFQVLFVNPIDPGNPVLFDGTATPAAAPVPEPASLWLLATGIASLTLARRARPRELSDR